MSALLDTTIFGRTTVSVMTTSITILNKLTLSITSQHNNSAKQLSIMISCMTLGMTSRSITSVTLLSITVLTKLTLGLITLNKTTRITTISIMTLSITTVFITIFRQLGLNATLSTNGTQHNDNHHKH
jgi:hypothetical protein